MNRAFRTAIVLVMATSLAGCVSSGKFNKLKAEQDVLKNEKAELEKQKADLQKQTTDLTQSNTQLKSDIDRLNAESASLAEPENDDKVDSSNQPTEAVPGSKDSTNPLAESDEENQPTDPVGEEDADRDGSNGPTRADNNQANPPLTSGRRPLKPAVGAAPQRSHPRRRRPGR